MAQIKLTIKRINRAFQAWLSLINSPYIGTGLVNDRKLFYLCLGEIYRCPKIN